MMLNRIFTSVVSIGWHSTISTGAGSSVVRFMVYYLDAEDRLLKRVALLGHEVIGPIFSSARRENLRNSLNRDLQLMI